MINEVSLSVVLTLEGHQEEEEEAESDKIVGACHNASHHHLGAGVGTLHGQLKEQRTGGKVECHSTNH